jgi:hypothetical protein
MNIQQKYKRAFIIGPMADMKRFNWLRDILQSLLEPAGFEVHSPDEGVGNIMQSVLLNLEQADILIVDLTGWNANVLYELGVYHSFGKPALLVREQNTSDAGAPFDIRAYRHGVISFDDADAARNVLKPALDAILNEIDRKDWFENPVTDFYESPVAEIPTAVGLSKNYISNFLKQLLPKSLDVSTKVSLWTKREDGSGRFVEIDPESHKSLHFEIRIPEELEFASHLQIDALKDDPNWELLPAQVDTGSRPFNLFYRKNNGGEIILVDIPTVLNTLFESIKKRRKPKGQRLVAEEDWKILEAQELERFAAKCELFKDQFNQDNPRLRGRLNVIWRWRP